MKTHLLVAASLLGIAASLAQAETIVIGDKIAVKETQAKLPTRGMSMKSVESRHGEPRQRHAAVGKPPITRWDYDGFSVYFENHLVVHAVAHETP
ncbi:MAG: hypothetical protein RLZZ200_302 [Pseudomonadota bacterium]|jgi:hypothetical protein